MGGGIIPVVSMGGDIISVGSMGGDIISVGSMGGGDIISVGSMVGDIISEFNSDDDDKSSPDCCSITGSDSNEPQTSSAACFAFAHFSSGVDGFNLFIISLKFISKNPPPRVRFCFLRWRRVRPYLLLDRLNVCAMILKTKLRVNVYIYIRYKNYYKSHIIIFIFICLMRNI
jgi:hypothetical protein